MHFLWMTPACIKCAQTDIDPPVADDTTVQCNPEESLGHLKLACAGILDGTDQRCAGECGSAWSRLYTGCLDQFRVGALGLSADNAFRVINGSCFVNCKPDKATLTELLYQLVSPSSACSVSAGCA
jgi:hypothetical protein